MAKVNKITPQEYIDLKDTINEYNNYIKNDIKNVVNELQNNYRQLFDVEEELLKEKLSSSQEMYQLYKDYLSKMTEVNNFVKEYSENANKLFIEYGISGDNLSKFLKRLSEIKRINEELLEENNAFNNLDEISQNSEVGERIMSKIISLENQRKNILSSLSSTEKKLLHDYETDHNETISETLELYKSIVEEKEKLNELEEKGIELSDKFNASQKKAAQYSEVVRNIWRGIVSVLSLGYEKWKEIDETVYTIGRSAGIASEQLREYQKNIMNNYDNMASTYGMTFKELFIFQEKYIKNIGRAIILSNEQVETMAGLTKLIGENATNEMVKNMDDFGASTNTASDYLAVNMYKAKLYGLDATKASESLAQNVKMASKYNFSDGVNGITKMTLMSQRLKFNMESIGNSLEKFETIEGAIETTANIQMLGGSFAANFSNPLTVMGEATLDAESFTQRIIDTVSDKAYFNRQTGMVEMSPLDKRFLKEFAKSIGLSYDEVWNIATQKTKENELRPYLNNGLTEDEKLFIINKSQFNKDLNRHELTYLKNGETRTIDIKEVNSDLVKEIRRQDDIDKSIQGDVQGIHQILKAKVLKDVGDTKSYNEMVKGIKESAAINVADMEDGALNLFKGGLGWLSSSNMWGTAIGVMMANKFLPQVSKWLDKKTIKPIGRGLYRLFGGGGGKAVSKKAAQQTLQNTNKVGAKLSKSSNKYVKIAGLLALAGAAIWGGSKLFSSSDSNNEHSEQIIVDSNSSILSELKVHTELLRVIANGKSLAYNTNYNSSYSKSSSNYMANNVYPITNKNNYDSNEASFDGYSLISLGAYYGLNTQQNRLRNGLTKVANKSNNKLFKKAMTAKPKAVKPYLKGGALAMGSLLTDVINIGGQSSGLWEEGSAADKTLSVGSKALEYAGWGSMIGSIVPGIGTALGAGIGAVLGGVVGSIQQYKKNKENEDKISNNENLTDLETNAYLSTIGIYENIEALRNDFLLANESYSYNGNPYQNSNALIESRTVSNNYAYNDKQSTSEVVEIKNENLNLNINGTLRLTSNNNDVNIDMKELLNNPQIKNQIVDIVYQGLNQRANQGRGYDKNAYMHIQGRVDGKVI